MIAQKIYAEQTNANTQIIRYSIHTKVVPFSGEEGNKQPSKQKEKERNIDINNKQKTRAATVMPSLLLSHIWE